MIGRARVMAIAILSAAGAAGIGLELGLAHLFAGILGGAVLFVVATWLDRHLPE